MTWVGDTLFARLLRHLARVVCRYPQWFIYPQILLFVLSVSYTTSHWKEDMDQDNLVGGATHDVYMKFREEFPGEDELAVVVQSGDMERNRQFVERLAARLEPETNLFTDVFYKGDYVALGRKALLFAPEDDLKQLQQALKDYRPFVEEFTEATNLDSFFGLINKQFRTAKQEENAQNNALISAIPALQRIVDQASDSLSRLGTPVSPGVTALFGNSEEAERRMYTTFAHGQIYLVTARARNPDVEAQAVERMRELMRQTEIEVPGLNAGLTGKPVLDYDEMQQAKRDALKASVVALVICSLIFIYAYHQTGRPLKAVACLIIGLGYTMAFTFLVVGHLNILTITFAPILIGLAIDFGIHLITRYEEEMRNGHTSVQSVDRAMVFTGQGIVTGALTTAMAFLAMGLTDFKGIQEMGIISGGGLVLCLIPMMTLLPVLLMKGRQNIIDHEHGREAEKRARIEDFWLQRPALVVVVTLLFCAAAALQFKKVYFDYNLLHMQSKGMPMVVYEMKLLNSGQSLLSAAVVADSLQEARQIETKLRKLPLVASVDYDDRGDPIFDLLTRDQTGLIKLVNSIKNEVSDLHFADADPEPVRLHELSATLYSTMGYMGQAADAVEKDRPDLSKQLRSLRLAISDLRVKMLSGDPSIPQRLQKFQEALFDDIRHTFETIQNQDTSSRLKPEDLPPAARNQFIGRTGRYKVAVFPKNDIWQHDNQRDFIAQLREAMAPHSDKVTGTPVQLYEYTTLLKNSYQQAALYALVAIAFMVFIHFRSPTCVILSLLPVAIGSTWTLGLMGWFGIPFNPANIMILPLVIGIGVTNGIQILNRVAEEQNPRILAKSTGKAVLVSGLTALTGFGSLTLAKHQGLQSLGLVMAMGIAACMVAALTFLPALLNILARYGWTVAKKKTQ
ncbi:MAG: MMPL family transporter [Verrucomicrobiota bacterium]|jgi:hopanoid biosynthesis associated RND transporter like protein HpnN